MSLNASVYSSTCDVAAQNCRTCSTDRQIGIASSADLSTMVVDLAHMFEDSSRIKGRLVRSSSWKRAPHGVTDPGGASSAVSALVAITPGEVDDGQSLTRQRPSRPSHVLARSVRKCTQLPEALHEGTFPRGHAVQRVNGAHRENPKVDRGRLPKTSVERQEPDCRDKRRLKNDTHETLTIRIKEKKRLSKGALDRWR